MGDLVKYSGLWAIATSWTLIVLPFYASKGKKKWNFMSQAADGGFWGTLFSIGMFLCAALQILFAYILSTKFKSGLPAIGVKIYFLAVIGYFIAGIVTQYKNYVAHVFFIAFYYFLMSYGFILIGFGLGFIPKILSILLLVIPSVVLLDKRNGVAFELWLMILLDLLVIIIYFQLGILNLI